MGINMCFLERVKEGKLFICSCCAAFIFGFFVFSYGREKYIYDDTGKRNPFSPLITADGRFINLDVVNTPKTLTFNIQGIMYEPTGISYAIVNAVIVKQGDTVEGNQVMKIEEQKVYFIKDGQILELELKNGGEDEK